VRGLVLLAVLVLVIAIIWSLRGPVRSPRPGGAALHRDRLVKDPMCRTYVVTARAIQREVAGDMHYFCSRECADRYGRGSDGGRRGPEDRLGERRA
jgi:YHS domain-containing protein